MCLYRVRFVSLFFCALCSSLHSNAKRIKIHGIRSVKLPFVYANSRGSNLLWCSFFFGLLTYTFQIITHGIFSVFFFRFTPFFSSFFHFEILKCSLTTHRFLSQKKLLYGILFIFFAYVSKVETKTFEAGFMLFVVFVIAIWLKIYQLLRICLNQTIKIILFFRFDLIFFFSF